MRKRIIDREQKEAVLPPGTWLDLEQLADVEITSEDTGSPIESALKPDNGPGWKAAEPGEQVIRLVFAAPVWIGGIRLVFREEERQRTQEFLLRWSRDYGRSFREIVRQQYNFSPPDTTREVEFYKTTIDEMTLLELLIVPDLEGGEARASLESLRLARLESG